MAAYLFGGRFHPVERLATNHSRLAQVSQRSSLHLKYLSVLAMQLLPRQKAMMSLEECVASRNRAIEKESRQIRVIGPRRLRRRGDEIGEVRREQHAARRLVIIGIAVADEIAIDEDAPAEAID